MPLRSVTDWAPIILGREYDAPGRPPYRAITEDLQRWSSLYARSTSAANVLCDTESAKQFFAVEKDLANIIPKAEWQESFYTLKNGFVVPAVPAILVYFVRRLWALHRIYNLIVPCLPKEVSKHIGSATYIGSGYTLRDVVCNFAGPDFVPLSEDNMLVRCGDWYEAYIPATDMVAALPLAVGERLRSEDMADISVTPGVGLSLRGAPLFLEQGVKNSFYDLR